MFAVAIIDVEELNGKLVSDKAKIREEGLKTLQGYLNSAGDVSLWSLLDQETGSDQNPIRSASWPGVLHALCICIDNEVAASKKKGPKPILAKILRNFVLKAEDTSRPGQNLSLLRKVKRLFQHVADMVARVPSFVPDYNNVLCQLLPVFEYRMRMGKKIYADLLHFYLEKAKEISQHMTAETSLTKEEAFRSMSTLLALLQHLPGDLPAVLLRDTTEDFIYIFKHLRDEGRIAKKLLAALNSFIVGNGLNIGEAVGNIHASVKAFMARLWLTTRDRELKDGLVLYARAQLKLGYILTIDDSGEISNLLDLVEKDLDQTGISLAGLQRLDTGREDKVGSIPKAMRSFFELAGTVLFEASKNPVSRGSNASKRRRKSDVNSLINDHLRDGKWMWCGAFCLLIRRFGSRLCTGVILNWLEGLASTLDRIMLEGINSRSFEGPIWTLRCLEELATFWGTALQMCKLGDSEISSTQGEQGENLWMSVWNALLHWLPLLSNVQVMVEEVFRLLGVLAAQNLVPLCSVPQDFWDLHRFTEPPSGNLLYFIASFFAAPNTQLLVGDLQVRKRILDWCLSSLDFQDVHRAQFIFGEQLSPRLFVAAMLALAFGVLPGDFIGPLPCLRKELSWPSSECEPYLEPDESEQVQELELTALDRSDGLLTAYRDLPDQQEIMHSNARITQLPRSSSGILLKIIGDHLLNSIMLASDASQSFTVSQLLHLSAILASCIQGVESAIERWGQLPPDWRCGGAIWKGLSNILDNSISIFYDISKATSAEHEEILLSGDSIVTPSSRISHIQHVTPLTLQSLQRFINSSGRCASVASGGVVSKMETAASPQPVLTKFLNVASKAFVSAGEKAVNASRTGDFKTITTKGIQEAHGAVRIIDSDLDLGMDTVIIGGGNIGDGGNLAAAGMNCISTIGTCEKSGDLRCSLIQIITIFGKVFPDATCATLADLLLNEKDSKVQGEILLSLCKTISVANCAYLPAVVTKMQDALSECQQNESMRYLVLAGMDALFTSLLGSFKDSATVGVKGKSKIILPAKISSQIAELIGKIAEIGLLFWPTRVKLIETISQFIVLDPSAAQVLTDRYLVLLHDPEYKVRVSLSRKVSVLFETWDGHDELLHDVCGSFGVKMAMRTSEGRFTAGDAVRSPQDVMTAETALLSLAEIAMASEQVEDYVVFMICAHVAVNPSSRPFAVALLNKVGAQMKYPSRWKYMRGRLGQLLTNWVISNMTVSSLLELKELLMESSGESDFLQKCCPYLLPWLIYYGHTDQIQWLASTLSLSIPSLVKRHFISIFAGILPLHSVDYKGDQRRAGEALQVVMLELAEMSEDERDVLIQKRMVSIVSSLFGLCSAREKPQLPYYSKSTIVTVVKTVVDGFLDSDQVSQDENVVDKMQVFRPDRVFKLLLEIHFEMFESYHPRHRRNLLTSLEAVLHVLDIRAVIPSTCRYTILIILQSIESVELQEKCCFLMTNLLDKLFDSGLEASNRILGEQLQSVVSKLVSCCVNSHSADAACLSRTTGEVCLPQMSTEDGLGHQQHSFVMLLLNRLIVDGPQSLHQFIKDLDPFPDLPCFKLIQAVHNKLIARRSLAEEFVQFVSRAPNIPAEVRLKTLKNLHKELYTRQKELNSTFNAEEERREWHSSAVVVNAVWKLIQLCDKYDDLEMKNLAGEFLAGVGVGDPHAVVFHVTNQGQVEHTSRFQENSDCNRDKGGTSDINIDSDFGLSEGLIACIIVQLRSYLIDPDVHVIQLASNTLKGVLSSEKGQRAFLSLNREEKTYLEMYSGGVNLKFLKDMVDIAKQKSSQVAITLEDSYVWQTSGKSYDVWVCTLTHALLEHTSDPILRLCQNMLLMKAPMAELVFPHALGALAGEHDSDSEFCILISKQVEEHLFHDKNQSTRSLQLFLNTLNSLRQCYIKFGANSAAAISKRKEGTKVDNSVKNGSGRSRGRHKHSSTGTGIVLNVDSTRVHVDRDPASWSKVYWLDVDYLSTARAAQQCAAYFTSVLYIEHWCEESFGSVTLGPPDFSSDELPLHLDLLLRVYTRINEPDGVYGVVRSHKVSSQLLRYEHEGNWSKALENYDLLLRSLHPAKYGGKSLITDGMSGLHSDMDSMTDAVSSKGKAQPDWHLHKGLMRSLQQKGCSHILDIYGCGISQQEAGLALDAEFKEMQYEAAWRTGNWDYVNLVTSKQPTFYPVSGNKEICYNAHLHSCLKSVMDGDAETFFSRSKMARQEIVTHIARTSMESTQNVNPLIVKLQILDYVSQAWEMRWSLRSQPEHSVTDLPSENTKSTVIGPRSPSAEQIAVFEANWQESLKHMQGHYELAEPYIAIHKILLKLLGLNDHIPDHLLQFATFSRKAGRLNHAGNSIHELKCICGETKGSSDALQCALSRHSVAGRVEEAKILWAEGHQEMAVNLAKYVLHLESNGTDSALLLCLTGKWLAETKSSSSRVILDSYLKRAVELSKLSSGEMHDQKKTIRSCRTHFRLAHYADALFRNHQERVMSSEWQSALRLRQHKAREFDALTQRLAILKADPNEDPTKIRECSMKASELHRQLIFDAEEAKHLQTDKEHFLSIALRSYGSCLHISNKYDLRVVFRLISLWFNLSTSKHVVDAMLETVEKVQSYKFLPLVYQIASRLGSSKDNPKELRGYNSFQKALTILLKKMAVEHPYHSLYQLFALANGDRVKEKQRGKNVFVVDMDKKRAAEELLESLTGQHKDLLSQVKMMIEVYIRLAEMETSQKEANKKVPIPRDIRNTKQLELVPVVTAPLPVDYSCQYQNGSFPYFKGFVEGIKVMIGINAPKYIECLGSDGNKYRQLAKSGNDDLRQDAVMEQLFGLVNKLLQDHPDTRKRNLGIRTYKVVPFTPSAGVLEWVDGTIPLGEYLLGSNRMGGAHGRYGGDDWSFMRCREHMATAKDKRSAFEVVLENFRPVMHYFFLENFARAEDWFEKRLSYTRSVATSSMVGYIVGLGDRHSMNILLDQATAEVVHIDLGVAFEQGLMLKTPERIPFRLTRDIIDGMGVTGVEGIFRRCCEATLSVLRTNKEALLTIIEVFIYDPLYNWALSPLKALQRQQDVEDLLESSLDTDNAMVDMEGNKDAARALLRVKQKLDGYEEGEMRSLQGQVQQLIQNAQDPERLSQLFPGWGAWL